MAIMKAAFKCHNSILMQYLQQVDIDEIEKKNSQQMNSIIR